MYTVLIIFMFVNHQIWRAFLFSSAKTWKLRKQNAVCHVRCMKSRDYSLFCWENSRDLLLSYSYVGFLHYLTLPFLCITLLFLLHISLLSFFFVLHILFLISLHFKRIVYFIFYLFLFFYYRITRFFSKYCYSVLSNLSANIILA